MSAFKKHHKPTFDNIPKEKRERILKVATNEFATNGFENTSIEQIAKKAGISVGSVYKYFDSKEDMFITVAHLGLSKLEELLTELYAKDEDLLIKVEKIIRELVAFSRREPDLIKIYGRLTASKSSPLLTSLAQEMAAVSAKIYTQSIIEGQKTGDVRKDIDPDFFAFLLDSLFMTLQFSYASDYYKQRYALYNGEGIFDDDEFMVEQTLKFIKAAFNFK